MMFANGSLRHSTAALADVCLPSECVAKLDAEQRASNNRIRLNGLLNRCCALVFVLESMLLIWVVEIVLQHGVIPGIVPDEGKRISSPETYGAGLMWPRNDGERRWTIMSDWTCR